MFILRVQAQKGQSNQELGEAYNLVTSESEDFAKLLEDHPHGEIYAFVVYKNGAEVRPLYKTQSNYIMCSDGKTFANVSHR